MTISEYQLRQKAYQLRQLDQEYFLHLSAWKNYEVQAQSKKGKKQVPVYPTFQSFFDYEKLQEKIVGYLPQGENQEFLDLVKKANT
ncbi:hypothetical protein JZO71_06730 [Enterococcus sp. MSG2901]|uniref:Uncharacterized protein n=2 Tax=Candidatus Enterococcus courvalinii TaxID=2815329 RepID=A0ABS3I1G5_9ENTE|nr:hypothetical protein [Enterococcus sp. MSG2901]